MTKTDLRLEYQKVTGDGLETINLMMEKNKREDSFDYITWLEDRLIHCRSVNHQLSSYADIKK